MESTAPQEAPIRLHYENPLAPRHNPANVPGTCRWFIRCFITAVVNHVKRQRTLFSFMLATLFILPVYGVAFTTALLFLFAVYSSMLIVRLLVSGIRYFTQPRTL